MRFLLRWVAFCFLTLSFAHAALGDDFFDTTLGDFAAELKTAQAQGKQGILLVLEAEGCPFCKRMREQIMSRAEVREYFHRHFNVFSLDVNGSIPVTTPEGKEMTEKAFARNLEFKGTPTFVFFAADGREMARHTGAMRDAETFLALGRYVAEGHWQRMSFEQFHRSR
ncbi:thioredoxin family protein [Sulfuricystis multivorans]|uniref:thioredoxin family protein n=1 Tax=Sulfuricystis multivorans TaxID=2211108 RepID=UPI000F8253B0|nr:thioredoxin family protein [Sulfuricystis multivorans]